MKQRVYGSNQGPYTFRRHTGARVALWTSHRYLGCPVVAGLTFAGSGGRQAQWNGGRHNSARKAVLSFPDGKGVTFASEAFSSELKAYT